MVRFKVIDVNTATSQPVCTQACRVLAARIKVVLSAHVVNVEDGSAPTSIVDTFAASEAVDVTAEFYGALFPDGCYIRNTNASATGEVVVFFEEVAL